MGFVRGYYNEQGLKPIHRIHYMNYSSADFASLTQRYDVNIRYKDEFLYYRFWKNHDQKPQQLKPPSFFHKVNQKIQVFNKKLKKLSTFGEIMYFLLQIS